MPMGAMMVMQAAGFAYLGRKLDKIQITLEAMQRDVRIILRHVKGLADRPMVGKLIRVAQGVEFLLHAQFKPDLIEQSEPLHRGEGRDPLVSIPTKSNYPHRVTCRRRNSYAWVSQLRLLASHFLLQARQAAKEETAFVFERYSGILGEVHARIAEAPNVIAQIPKSPEYVRHYPGRKRLQRKLQATVESIECEKGFAAALGTLDPEGLCRLQEALDSGSEKGMLVAYPAS